jgi:hypothetical protein
VIVYSERLSVPWWWWPIGFALVALPAWTVHLGAGLSAWLPGVLLLPLPVWVLWWLGRYRVEVRRTAGSDGRPQNLELRVERAHLTADFVGRTAAVPATAKSAAMGRQLDPAAFVVHRPWIGSMALLTLEDPADPTPYWLVSTRRPERLLAALASSQTASDGAQAQ